MSGPLGRIIAQVVVMGAGIVSKAFVQAYQQAVHNARTGNAGAMAAKTVVRKNQMPKQQAREILNFPTSGPAPSSEEIQKQFTRYFEANDPAKGGSFYLQSKIFRAKEALELKKPDEEAPPSDAAKDK
jgi:import inner membrane translocase subunit TIM16